MPDKKSKPVGRMARTIRSLLFMGILGGVLTAYSLYANSRDIKLATGPAGEAQHAFFVQTAERPDIEIFFQSLKPAQRLAMSQNVGMYDDPAMAKLIGKCLTTFDPNARKALTESLAKVARTQPKAVAEQLALKGSFQQLAVANALKLAGTAALPLAAERLTNGDARPNAIAFLVSSGAASVTAVMPMLLHKDKDVRLAAADTLGKLRAREAVPQLVKLYDGSTGDEHFGYLGAIAGIGDPSTEKLLAKALNDERLPVDERAQAALGLGRVATPSAIALLWGYPSSEQPQLRRSSISALQVAGDPAVGVQAPLEQKLLVAEGIHSRLADAIIAQGLAQPSTRLEAATVAKNRAEVVPQLLSALDEVHAETEGDVADRLVTALASTPQGLAVLREVRSPVLKGLVDRRLKVGRAL